MPFNKDAVNLVTQVLIPASAANTAAATSATGVDLQGYIGSVAIAHNVGVITGTLDGKIQDCDTLGGTYVDVPGLTFTQVTAANKAQAIVVPVNSVRRFIKYVGVIATGPAVMGVTMHGQKAYIP